MGAVAVFHLRRWLDTFLHDARIRLPDIAYDKLACQRYSLPCRLDGVDISLIACQRWSCGGYYERLQMLYGIVDSLLGGADNFVYRCVSQISEGQRKENLKISSYLLNNARVTYNIVKNRLFGVRKKFFEKSWKNFKKGIDFFWELSYNVLVQNARVTCEAHKLLIENWTTWNFEHWKVQRSR